jgi:hypothetical protein
MDEEQLEQPQLEQEVEDAYKRRGFWDRKLAASLIELEQIKEVMSKYRYDQEEMKKRIRKVKKNSKGLINTIKVLDIQPEDLTEKVENATLDFVNEDSQQTQQSIKENL